MSFFTKPLPKVDFPALGFASRSASTMTSLYADYSDFYQLSPNFFYTPSLRIRRGLGCRSRPSGEGGGGVRVMEAGRVRK